MFPIQKSLVYNPKRITKYTNKKKGSRRWMKYLPPHILEYFQTSSIHCLRYFVYPDWPPLLRFAWGLVFVICLTGAVLSSINSYYTYVESPLVMSVGTSSFHISNVHFPAVAICNVNTMLRSKVWELSHRLSQGSNLSEVTIFNYIKHLGNMYSSRRSNQNIVQLHKILTKYGQENNITAILEDLAPTCENLLKLCIWKGLHRPCYEIFRPMLTIDNGFCCLFNYNLSFELLFPEYYGSSKSKTPEAPDVEFSALGLTGGLSVHLDLEANEYVHAELPTTAANVIVFSALSIQDAENGNSMENLVPLGTEVFLRLETAVTYSVSRIEKWPPEKRNCDFSYELKEYFKGFYSYPSCLVACRIRNVTKTCGCLPIFMPKKDDGEIIPFCNLSNLSCLNAHKRMWSKDPVGRSKANRCNCRPACNREHYSLRSWHSHLASANYRPLNIETNTTRYPAKFHLFSGNAHTTRYRKDILLQESHLFSNLAGLCSLFLGCSFMSLVEIVYFFLIRPFCNKCIVLQKKVVKRRKKNKINIFQLQNKLYKEEHDRDRTTVQVFRRN